MKPEELRIGNLIAWSDQIQTVIQVSNDGFIQCDPLAADREISEFEPIPLTEDRLIKFGFKPDKGGFTFKSLHHYESYFHLVWYYFAANEGVTEGWLSSINGKEIPIGPKIEFVHHLQNLYFDCYGYELIYKY